MISTPELLAQFQIQNNFTQIFIISSKMATTPIYGKTPLQIFSRTRRSMTLGLGM